MKPSASEKHIGRTYVVAEIGINHCGDLKTALQLVDQAKEAGADAVKFQTFKTEKLVRPGAVKMPYQTQNSDQNQFEMLKQVELDREQHLRLIDYSRQKEIDFISTPYDWESADLLAELKVDAIKIASTDTTNVPFLRYVATLGFPIICSSGVTDMWELVKAVNEGFSDFDRSRLTILHCVSNYPAPLHELNLKCIRKIGRIFNCRTGFSDHSASLLTGAYAVCAGSAVIEKHFTYSRQAPGPDHRASLEPEAFAVYVKHIREAEQILGDGVKQIQASEKSVKFHMQKSLVASRMLPAGTVLAPEHLSTMRPAEGISPLFYDDIIGKTLIYEKKSDAQLHWRDLADV